MVLARVLYGWLLADSDSAQGVKVDSPEVSAPRSLLSAHVSPSMSCCVFKINGFYKAIHSLSLPGILSCC